MIRKLKSAIYGMRNAIQDAIEAKQAVMTASTALLFQPVDSKPGLFHRDAKHRAFVRKLVANHKSRKLHKAILAGKAPRGRTV
jgi:hypothetical protein